MTSDRANRTNRHQWRPVSRWARSVRGSKASVGFLTPPARDRNAVRATVGKFLGICTGESLLVGVITNVLIDAPALAQDHGWHSTADVDLVGEIKQSGGSAQFQRGVTD